MKNKKEFLVKFVVTQSFTNSLDVSASSEEEAIIKVKKLISGIKISRQASLGYLQDNKNISPYWCPDGEISIDTSSFEVE